MFPICLRQQTSPDTCRFEVACGQCLDGCDSDLRNVAIERTMLPTCEPIPAGVWPSSTAIVLQTFDVKKGYFRISSESPIVLECFQKDACIGGINASNYCAIGYEGPCESVYMHTRARTPDQCRGRRADGVSRSRHRSPPEGCGTQIVFQRGVDGL